MVVIFPETGKALAVAVVVVPAAALVVVVAAAVVTWTRPCCL